MPQDSLKLVTFNEGEPFDPSKLNLIQANAQQAYTSASSVYNSLSSNGQSKTVAPIIKSDQAKLGTLEAGSTTTFFLPTDIRTEGLPAPHVVATLRNRPIAGLITTIFIHDITGAAAVSIYTNKKITNCLIDWIAITYKDVSQA